MASTPPPPQYSTLGSGKPSQNHQYPQNQHRRRRDHHHQNRRQNNPPGASNNVSHSKPSPASNADPAPPRYSSLASLPSRQSLLAADFSGRRSTRFISKMHSGRPRASPNTGPHSPVAEEALPQFLQCGNDATVLEGVLLKYEPRLCGADDYIYLIRELGDRGQWWIATRCYDFAVRKESRRYEQGRLTSTMISTLGRLNKVDLAKSVFEKAKNEGYGNTVYSFSALISAYGRNGCYDEAMSVFEALKNAGLKPNLVTYNALIDASGKGGVEFMKVVEIFYEMQAAGVQPDRITYNSLIAVCSKVGMWEIAQDLFNEMVERGIDQDIFTYNTLLDALCKSKQMDLATEVMADMPAKKIFPNVVTYSTMIDGYAKADRLEEALNLFNEMKFLSFELDRISYNTLLAVYAKLGRFEEALAVCKEMESCGIEKDAATYNALLAGYGKQGKFDEVRRVYEEMQAANVYRTVLTYSTLIDVYSKGGLYEEAMDVFREFMQSGLKTDVVLYSALIDALCKNGLMESAVMLLDEMLKFGIRPNVVTYNAIIDAFGYGVDTSLQANGHRIEPSSSMLIAGPFQNQVEDTEDKQIIKMFGQLAAARAVHLKKDKRGKQDMSCILWLFQKIHEMELKPNVVTFSAILNACSRCNSFKDASTLLEELRLWDNHVYGVAHGLLMGYGENIWVQALSLFDEVKHMDSDTASAFYNALTDMLWHFGQKRGTQLVVFEGKRRNVWEGVWSDSCLDLHLMSCGAACASVHAWLLNIRSVVFEGCELPKLFSILTGWGKHSKVVGDGNLRRVVEALLNGMGAPFRIAGYNMGRFISTGPVVAAWLKKPSTLNVLVVHDHICNSESARSGQVYNVQPLYM